MFFISIPLFSDSLETGLPSLSRISLIGKLKFIEGSHEQVIEEIRSIPENSWQELHSPSAGFSSRPVWFRLRFLPEENQPMFLEIENALFNSVTVHFQFDSELSTPLYAGLLVPKDRNNSIQTGFPVFPFQARKNVPVTVYIKIESDVPLRVPVFLSTKTGFLNSLSWKRTSNGIFFSVMLTLVTANIIFWFHAKQKLHLYLGLNLFFYTVFQVGIDGLLPPAPKFIPGQLFSRLTGSAIFISEIFLSLFFINFLINKKGLDLTLKIHRLIRYSAATLIAITFIDFSISNRIAYLIAPFIHASLVITAFIAWKKNNTHMRFFAMAFLVAMVPVGIYLLQQLGFFTGYTQSHTLKLFLVFYAFILTMSLLDRIAMSQEVYNANLKEAVENRTHELLKVVERLEDVSRVKDHVIRLVSHDIRSPLSAIKTNIPLLRSTSTASPENRDALLEQMELTIVNVLNLSNGLLDEKRIREGKPLLEPEWLELHKIVELLIQKYKNQSQAKEVLLENLISDRVEILADRILFSQVLENLLNNSIKFCRPGDRINFQTHDSEPYEIRISDTGIGMDDATLKNLFDPSVVNTRPGTENEKGKGFGLIIVKDTIEKHGGKIRAESEKGAGSTFILSFPKKYFRTNRMDQKKIALIVDDDPFMRRLLKRHIDPFPLIVLEAGDGHQAGRIIAKTNPDLILTDILMPEMNGDDLIRNLNRNEEVSRVKLWVMTGETDVSQEWSRKMRELGVSEIWIKPIQKKKFQEMVAASLSLELESENEISTRP